MQSIVSYPNRGEYGKNAYRGNCSGLLIEDLIKQYNLRSLNDYMVGSGTTEDVCRKHNISGDFYDLNRGYDMLSMDIPQRAENIFWHPPYDNIVVYSGNMFDAEDVIQKYGYDPRINDLSRCKDWTDFVEKMNYCCLKQFSALDKGGRMFILMGDIKKKGILHSMLTDIVKPGTMEQIIIKTQHNCWSDSRTYNGNFVKIVHEYVLVLRKDNALYYPVQIAKSFIQDIRDVQSATWRDVIASVIQSSRHSMTVNEIAEDLKGHKKAANNQHLPQKIRQILNRFPEFVKENGRWCYQYTPAT